MDTSFETEDVVGSVETEVTLLIAVDLSEDIVFFDVVEVVVLFTEDLSVLVITGAVDNIGGFKPLRRILKTE